MKLDKRRGFITFQRSMPIASSSSSPTQKTRGEEEADPLEAELPLPQAKSGFLPPHLGERFVVRDGASPYRISPRVLVERFATSSKRRVELTRGLFRMRAAARELGLITGFQWIGGSFVDDKPDPDDIDVVTFYVPPASFKNDGKKIIRAHPEIFRPTQALAHWSCDAYFIALRNDRKTFRLVSLWYGLFSHDRATCTWKGFLELGLTSHGEKTALTALDALDALDHVK